MALNTVILNVYAECLGAERKPDQPENQISGFVSLPGFDQSEVSGNGLLQNVIPAIENLKEA